MYYLDGMAVYNKEVVFSFMDLEAFKKIGSFYMIDKASPKRFEGWSLDSLSISKEQESILSMEVKQIVKKILYMVNIKNV